MKAVEAGVDGLIVRGRRRRRLQEPRRRLDVGAAAGGAREDRRAADRRRRHLRRPRHGGGFRARRGSGMQMGTRFVSSAESPVHANYKQAIVDVHRHRHGDAQSQVPARRACARSRPNTSTAIYEAGTMDRCDPGQDREATCTSAATWKASVGARRSDLGPDPRGAAGRRDQCAARSKASTPSVSSRPSARRPGAF